MISWFLKTFRAPLESKILLEEDLKMYICSPVRRLRASWEKPRWEKGSHGWHSPRIWIGGWQSDNVLSGKRGEPWWFFAQRAMKWVNTKIRWHHILITQTTDKGLYRAGLWAFQKKSIALTTLIVLKVRKRIHIGMNLQFDISYIMWITDKAV